MPAVEGSVREELDSNTSISAPPLTRLVRAVWERLSTVEATVTGKWVLLVKLPIEPLAASQRSSSRLRQSVKILL